MNKEEFKEMQDEFAVIIYNYERFLKDSILTDYRYNVHYNDLLQKIRLLDVENGMLARCLSTHAEKPEEDIKPIITQMQEAFLNQSKFVEQKTRVAKAVMDHEATMTPELNQQFERMYIDFIRENHPVVKALITPEEKDLYEKLKIFYYENNYEGFKNAFEATRNVFKTVEYPEDTFAKISQYYYDIRVSIGNDFAKRQNEYPFVKKKVFEDDMSIAYEEGELKSNITRLLRDNKKLHEDFVSTFHYDVQIVEQA